MGNFTGKSFHTKPDRPKLLNIFFTSYFAICRNDVFLNDSQCTLFTKIQYMEEQKQTQTEGTLKTTAGQGFGIAGMVLGILALIVAFIPCIGIIAIAPGAIAILLSVIGLIQANQKNGAKGLIIAALVISILATSIAAIWGIVIGGISREGHIWRDRVERIIESTDQESIRELETSLKMLGGELERTFGDIEDFDPELYDFGEEVSDEEFEKIMQEYEKTVSEFARLASEVERGELSAIVKYSTVSIRAASLATTLLRIGPKLSEDQMRRLEEVTERYENILDEVEE